MTYRIMIRSGVNSRDGESSKEVEACWERRELEKPDSLKSSIRFFTYRSNQEWNQKCLYFWFYIFLYLQKYIL